MKVYLGIDTSNYKTSVALVDEEGHILLDERKELVVEHGALGLRQSEAVFCHIRQLPPLVEKAFACLPKGDAVAAVGVSTQPRKQQGSYMPVFIAGHSTAQNVAAALGVPVCCFSHQQGHLRAAAYGQQMPGQYIGVHVSGGTTEILQVDRAAMSVEILGGSRDIAAGQWIDRVGVKMGLPFPSGQHLEALAGKTAQAVPFSVLQKGMDLYFTGAETQAKQAIEQGQPQSAIARGVFLSLAKALYGAVAAACQNTGLQTVLLAGGVMANALVRAAMEQAAASQDITLCWADPPLSGDNAVGIALLTKEQLC